MTAVPTPITDMGSDLWFLHQLTMNTFVFASGVGFQDRGVSVTEIDSKAMRKVDIGQDMVVVGELSGNSGGGMDMTVGGRMLVKVN